MNSPPRKMRIDITSSVIIGSGGVRLSWACKSFDELGVAHFEPLAEMGAELIIFGSGKRIRFPQADWIRSLIEQGTGVETMDTHAACRTYNILAGEGRHVIVALLLEPI